MARSGITGTSRFRHDRRVRAVGLQHRRRYDRKKRRAMDERKNRFESRSRRKRDGSRHVRRSAPPHSARCMSPLGLGLSLERLLRFGDQLLDFLTAFVSDFFIEIRAVLVLDDFAAFLTDRFVEFCTMTFARYLSTFATNLFVEA